MSSPSQSQEKDVLISYHLCEDVQIILTICSFEHILATTFSLQTGEDSEAICQEV